MLTKQEYQELPSGYRYESHVDTNVDIYDTKPMVVFEEQSKIIDSVLRLVSDYPEEDEDITCKQTETTVDYYYKNKLVLSVDSYTTEHHYMICFNYRVYGIDKEIL